MALRLRVIVALGLVAVTAAGGLALSLRGSTSPPKVSPTWGLFSDAQWRLLGSRLAASGFEPGSLRMVTATGPQLSIVSASRATGGHRCFVVVRRRAPGAPLCGPSEPLTVFGLRHGKQLDLVGLVPGRVTSVVYSWQQDGSERRSGVALLPAGNAAAFGLGYVSRPLTLTAYDAENRVVARLYCASALRAVCGTSAQRRS